MAIIAKQQRLVSINFNSLLCICFKIFSTETISSINNQKTIFHLNNGKNKSTTKQKSQKYWLEKLSIILFYTDNINGVLEFSVYPWVWYRNALLDYNSCVFPTFLFPLKYLLLMPNTGHYTPKSPCLSSNGLLFTWNSLSGYVPMRAVPSIHCEVFFCTKLLREASGRGVFKWVRLRWCAQKYLSARNLLCQSQSQTQLPGGYRVCRGFGTQSPQSIREYDLATAIVIWTLTQYLKWKMGSYIFAAMSWLKVSSITWTNLTIISLTEKRDREMFTLVMSVLPVLVLLHFSHLGKIVSIPPVL